MSIYNSASGMATGDWNRVAGAYGYGPLGQTADAGGFYYYGTRGALVTSGMAAAAAGGGS